MSSVLSAKHFHDEAAAYAWVEARVWPEGPVCLRCKGMNRVGKMGGASTRIGTYKCYACRKPFTVKVGTVFESSHVAMTLWLQAMFLLTSSKKGISSNQLSRTLGVTLKTAWFMSHRIRHAMQSVGLAPMGGEGTIVESDETFIGNVKGMAKPKGGHIHKHAVLTLVQRGGEARSFHVNGVGVADLKSFIVGSVNPKTDIMTDELVSYRSIGKGLASHESVSHRRKEYVRDNVTTNTVESYFSVFKRGMRGIYQHCDEQHLHRHLAEFDFRYFNRIALSIDDAERANRALVGIKGKRLTYRTTH